jgi:glycosyltransferase involved in cell wall biosynthesis
MAEEHLANGHVAYQSRPMRIADGKVAIVHDYLNQFGGAERVVLELSRIWRQAPIYTSLYRPESTFPEFLECDVRTSPLDRLPVDRGFRNLFPLYPGAFRSLGALSEDVVLSSSSGWAHWVKTAPESFHAVYCYTPARWLYGGSYLGASVRQRALRPFVALLRAMDRSAARRADLYIAISECVRQRIRHVYSRDAPIVYPPVDVERFRPAPRGERLLVVSRLLPYKRVDVIVAAASKAGIGLDVVGTGPALDDLRCLAGPSVTFHGRLDDEAVTEMMEGCRAFCLPGEEDFGITPVEAHAAGKPVIAFAGGGALETVEDGFSGVFFDRHDVDCVLDALHRCDQLTGDRDAIAQRASRFSAAAFREQMLAVIENAMEARAGPRQLS